LLPASGTFVADSGRSIFLEQHLTQHGQVRNFRWEIPYQYIVRLEEVKDLPFDPSCTGNTPVPAVNLRPKDPVTSAKSEEQSGPPAAAAAGASGDHVAMLPFRRPSNTA
jgi:hypothetical protein